MTPELLQIGAVCRPHGLNGDIRVKLHDPASQALEGLRRMWTGPDTGASEPERVGFREWRIHKVRRLEDGFYLLGLEGLCNRTGAESLRTQRLYARRADLPELAEDEIYLADLIGCRVSTSDGKELGVAKDVQDIAGNQLLLIERAPRPEALVPLVPAILLKVDLENRVLYIDPPEGLLDLDVSPARRQ
jgi:16S rRNA processing protein RimM